MRFDRICVSQKKEGIHMSDSNNLQEAIMNEVRK